MLNADDRKGANGFDESADFLVPKKLFAIRGIAFISHKI